jgi:hypothetical protein
MMMSKSGLVVILALGVMTAFGYWRYQVSGQTHGVAQFEFIQDASDSIHLDCARSSALAERVIAMPESGPGSTITLLTLGDEATANEPQFVGEFRIPVVRRVIEGQRAAAREQQALLNNVKSRCSEVRPTHRSPIFEGLKRGVEHLQSVGAPEDFRYLFIQTDGEETENKRIRQALNEPPGTKLRLPSPIDNKSTRITFCGLAETIGSLTEADHRMHRKSADRDSRRADRLREVWSNMFTNAELVTIEPYCTR